jgi:hypothetical protein
MIEIVEHMQQAISSLEGEASGSKLSTDQSLSFDGVPTSSPLHLSFKGSTSIWHTAVSSPHAFGGMVPFPTISSPTASNTQKQLQV